MTFKQRMAELGVDLSDLNIDVERANALYVKYYDLAEAVADEKGIELNALLMIMLVLHDIAERDDIIDRIETRIVNLTGERDWLKHMLCEMCDMETNGPSCAHCNVKTGGVPEDWRPDE